MKNFRKLFLGVFAILFIMVLKNTYYANENIEKESNSIEQLFEERNTLIIDYESNETRIQQIDKELVDLGVNQISYNEIQSKINTDKISTFMKINYSNTIKWTSERKTTCFRGKMYEVQIIRGVPINSSSSELLNSYLCSVTNKESFSATAKNILQIIVPSAAGKVPVIGGSLSTSLTAFDVFKSIYNSYSTGTIISNIKCSTTISNSATYMYVFVKYSGDVDAGHQILGYAGNSIYYCSTVVIPSYSDNKGTVIPTNKIKEYSGTISAPFYNDYVNKACENFYNYQNGDSNITQYFNILSYKFISLNTSFNIKTPYPNSGF